MNTHQDLDQILEWQSNSLSTCMHEYGPAASKTAASESAAPGQTVRRHWVAGAESSETGRFSVLVRPPGYSITFAGRL